LLSNLPEPILGDKQFRDNRVGTHLGYPDLCAYAYFFGAGILPCKID